MAICNYFLYFYIFKYFILKDLINKNYINILFKYFFNFYILGLIVDFFIYFLGLFYFINILI
jgi:hypothetical protein